MVVVGLEVANFTEQELRQEILTLRLRVSKLAALLRLAGPVTSLRIQPVGRTSAGRTGQAAILRAVERARKWFCGIFSVDAQGPVRSAVVCFPPFRRRVAHLLIGRSRR